MKYFILKLKIHIYRSKNLLFIKIFKEFKYFDIEPSNNCVYDHILIENIFLNAINNSISNNYCGSEIPLSITSTNNSVIVKLITDESGSRSGFQFKYSSG